MGALFLSTSQPGVSVERHGHGVLLMEVRLPGTKFVGHYAGARLRIESVRLYAWIHCARTVCGWTPMCAILVGVTTNLEYLKAVDTVGNYSK